MLDRVKVIRARGIGARRNSDALKEWPIAGKPGECEIADHPAICQLIIHYKWISIILILAGRASQRGEESVV